MQSIKALGKKAAPILAASSLLLMSATPVNAATLTTVSVTPSSAAKAATGVSYNTTASGVTLSTIKCIKVRFNTASDGSGTKPTGMNVAGAVLDATTNYIPTPAGWTVTNDDATGTVRITHPTTGETPTSASSRSVVLGGITNATNAGTYYMLLNTYDHADCTTTPVDDATAAFAITDGQTVTVTVDPSFSFVVAGLADTAPLCNGVDPTVTTTATAVNFGSVAAGNTAVGTQRLEVDSNAAGGYVVYARTTGVLKTVGGATIPDLAGGPQAFGTGAGFGFTSGDADLAANFSSGMYNGDLAAVASPGAPVAKGLSGATYTDDQTCVGFGVKIGGSTSAGAYATSLIYTAVATF